MMAVCPTSCSRSQPGRASRPSSRTRARKTIHLLAFIDDENYRRGILIQLNRLEGRHGLARAVFHGKRGELRQAYREGQEDQLGALGLVLNAIVLWNTRYMDAALRKLRADGVEVLDEDVERFSPLVYGHVNLLGRYHFAVPEAVLRVELRPLRDPNDPRAQRHPYQNLRYCLSGWLRGPQPVAGASLRNDRDVQAAAPARVLPEPLGHPGTGSRTVLSASLTVIA